MRPGTIVRDLRDGTLWQITEKVLGVPAGLDLAGRWRLPALGISDETRSLFLPETALEVAAHVDRIQSV